MGNGGGSCSVATGGGSCSTGTGGGSVWTGGAGASGAGVGGTGVGAGAGGGVGIPVFIARTASIAAADGMADGKGLPLVCVITNSQGLTHQMEV